MKLNGLAAALLFATISSGTAAAPAARAPGPAWQPGRGLVQIALWPVGQRIFPPETKEREATVLGSSKVGGRPWTAAMNVSTPTMTIYSPRGRNSGAALMVFPGGGYQVLAMDLEGSEICDWAANAGMTCILLKYRVPQNWHKDPRHEQPPRVQLALQDAQRAMGLVRQRAAALHVDPHRIGVIGFSAGGHLVAAISNAEGLSYAPVDAADQLSSRPDFAIALYPGHLWSGHGVELSPWNRISPHAPPTLLVQSIDDPVDDVHHSISYALALRKAKVPVDLHLYAKGGHAFGLRPSAFPISHWPELAEKWLRDLKLL